MVPLRGERDEGTQKLETLVPKGVILIHDLPSQEFPWSLREEAMSHTSIRRALAFPGYRTAERGTQESEVFQVDFSVGY